jgi:hypothetical protein
MSGDVRAFTTDIMLANGNGLPDLHLSPLDPLEHVQAEFAARNPDASMASAVSTGTGDAIKTALGVPSLDDIKSAFAGGARLVVMLVLGLILVAIGLYQFTRD